MPARRRRIRRDSLKGLERQRLEHLQDDLSVGLAPDNYDQYTFTAQNAANTITVAGEDTLAADLPRVMLNGDIPAELNEAQLYWLSDAGVNLYNLHLTKADAAAGTNIVAFTDDGTGTLTMTVIPG